VGVIVVFPARASITPPQGKITLVSNEECHLATNDSFFGEEIPTRIISGLSFFI